MPKIIPLSRISRALKRIKVVTFDVDGVLTDDKLIYGSDGTEYKRFCAKDGVAIKMLQANGIQVAIISGRESTILRKRADELGIKLIYEKVENKLDALNDLLIDTKKQSQELMHVGNDLPDIILFENVGISVAVKDAHHAVVKRADLVTSARGGEGVAAEVCMWLLRTQNKWEFD